MSETVRATDWPPLHSELVRSHEYGDETTFSDGYIYDALNRYEILQHRNELPARAMGEVAIICARLAFEFEYRRSRQD